MRPDDTARVHLLLRRAVRCARAQRRAVAPRNALVVGPARPPACDDVAVEVPVRAALRTACAGARARGMRVEQLLVLLKTAWWRTAATGRGGQSQRRQEEYDALARVVTLCIEEFYTSPTPDRPPHDRPAP